MASATAAPSTAVDQFLAALDRDVDRILEKRRFLLARKAEETAELKGTM